jgi:hypothetical protein
MKKLKALFNYFKGYVDKSLAKNTNQDRIASNKIKQAYKELLGKKD